MLIWKTFIMTKFNIKNFTNPTEECSPISEPDWLHKATDKVRFAYNIATTKFNSISKNIDNGVDLSPKGRKLVLAQIALEVDVDRSYLTPRRTPDFCNLIKDYNADLENIWADKNRSKKKGSSSSKTELQKELAKYKRLYVSEREKNYSDQISKLLESELYGRGKRMAQKCADLEEDNKRLNETVSNLRSKLRGYTIKSVD